MKQAPMGPECRVMLVDDHWFVREAFGRMLDARPDMRVVATAASRAEALGRAVDADPDVALLDLGLPDGNGVDLAAALKQRIPLVRCVLFSAHDTTAIAGWARGGAVDGIIGKDAEPEDVHRHLIRIWRRPRAHRPLVGAPVPHPLGRLSAREHQVFFELGRGRTTKEIAADFRLSSSTIDKYKQAIRDKFALGDHDKLLRLAALIWQQRPTAPDERRAERALVAAFEARAIAPDGWTHRAWLWVAFHRVLTRPLDEAAIHLAHGVDRLARTHGTPPPPRVAVTRAAAAVHARLAADPVHLTAQGFLAAHPDLLGADPERLAFTDPPPSARAGARGGSTDDRAMPSAGDRDAA